ncbi:surface lipoprotein assembly modifier [Pelagibacterium sediminicola]|uniref:surface lipoprotein assembly modifier n=1 Tax=Pelagibacterium sediminicola TaxID=2248761 RepID=UPI000E31126D|nr:surface lipoprotein assembly modifier [Pelagibacterium sediminicola]
MIPCRSFSALRRKILATLSAILLINTGAPAHGAPVASASPTLEALVASGAYDAARHALAEQIADPTLHSQHRTHLEALIARSSGDHRLATALFRAALAIDPTFLPSRIQLVQTLIAVGDIDGARHHLAILALHPTPQVRQRAQATLDRLAAQQGFGGSMSISLSPSSNFNKGSAHDTFVVGNMAFAINPDSRQASGTGLTIGGDMHYTFALPEHQQIVAALGGSVTTSLDNTTRKQFDLNTGLYWQGRLESGRVRIGPTASLSYANDAVHLLRYGLTGQATLEVAPQNLISLSFAALGQTYPAENFRDGYKLITGAGLTHAFTPATRLSLHLGGEIERTQRPHLDHDDISAEIRLNHDWSGGLITSTFAKASHHRYRGDFPGLSAPREDTHLGLGTTVSHSGIDLGGFTPTLTYQYTRQFSNVTFFDYDSHDVSLGLTRAF